MKFGQAINSGFANYANFRGRACRSEFWFWMVFISTFGHALGRLDGWLHTSFISNLFSLATLVPTMAMTFRRLHDINLSGWWSMVFHVPWIGFSFFVWWVDIVGADEVAHAGNWILVLPFLSIGALIGGVLLIVTGCIKGTNGSNRFGPDPLGSGLDETSHEQSAGKREGSPVKTSETKKCAACEQTVRAEAKVCKHCGYDFEHPPTATNTPAPGASSIARQVAADPPTSP